MANILVTGGAGFIGYHVAKTLLDRKDSVVVVDNFNEYYNPKLKHDRINQLKDYKKLKIYVADISNDGEIEDIFSKHKFKKICHLAAQAGVRYSIENPFVYELWNVKGTLNLLELAKKHRIKDFVFASSSSVYGRNKIPFSEEDQVDSPVSFYAATKRFNELSAHVYHDQYGLNCTGLRFFTCYGPWGRPDMAMFKFVENIISDKPIEIYGYGKMSRDFTYIDDVVQATLAALDRPQPYEIINIGNNKPVELTYLIDLIEKELGKKAEKIILPMQPGDVPVTCAKISKAKRILGWQPKISIGEGIKNFISWYKNYKNENYSSNTLL